MRLGVEGVWLPAAVALPWKPAGRPASPPGDAAFPQGLEGRAAAAADSACSAGGKGRQEPDWRAPGHAGGSSFAVETWPSGLARWPLDGSEREAGQIPGVPVRGRSQAGGAPGSLRDPQNTGAGGPGQGSQ